MIPLNTAADDESVTRNDDTDDANERTLFSAHPVFPHTFFGQLSSRQ